MPVIAVNKPKGPTSHDIIDQLRRITGEKRIGHAGTLDPLASGVLVVAIGRESTKKLAEEVAKEKEYLAEIKLGQTSTTDDEEGLKRKFSIFNSQFPNKEQLKEALKKFTGTLEQTPPQYSAVKISGKPAYKLARGGQTAEIKSRKVEIKLIEIIDYKYPILKLKIVCGSGVYIRSLARDLGEKLGTGAYLSDLIRTRVGDFTLKKSITVENFLNQHRGKG